MSTRVDPRYICQSAANAIIAEIGPYQVSNDALQTINQFLDEFLGLLLSSSLSLDLSRVKAVVFTLLPSTLGKNAIVEAELEVKTFTETEAIDFESYERMRQLGIVGPFPLHDVLELLREKCHEFCTLAERQLQSQLQQQRQINPNGLVIVPIVAIYVTTILEHIGEYVLTAIAMTAEHEDTDHIKIKEVFLALIDDVQVGGVFYRMDLREKLERRAQTNGYRPRIATPSFIAPSTRHLSMIGSTNNDHHPHQNNKGGDLFDLSFDDLDYDVNSHNDHLSLSGYSSFSSQQRPMSLMSGTTSNGTFFSSTFEHQNNKKAYKLFKKEEMPMSSTSIYDPDGSSMAMDFDDLIRSGDTMKASLTPNRLKSIEIKDQMRDDPPKASWERRSTANLSLSALSSSTRNSRIGTPSPLSPQQLQLQLQHQQKQLPNLTTNPPARFENPRDPPKPPHLSPAATSPLDRTPASPTAGHVKQSYQQQQQQQPAVTKLASRSPPPRETPTPAPAPASAIPLVVANKTATPQSAAFTAGLQPPAVVPTPSLSTPSVPAPTIPTPLTPSVSTPVVAPEPKILEPPVESVPEPITATTVSGSTTSLPVALAAPETPNSVTLAPETMTSTNKKEVTVPATPIIMRRSSSSNKLTRENLRRKREAAKEQLMGSSTKAAVSATKEREEQETTGPVTLTVNAVTPIPPSPPASERSLTDEETSASKIIITKSDGQQVKTEEYKVKSEVKEIKPTPAVVIDDEKNTGSEQHQERTVTSKGSTSSLKTWDTMVKEGDVTPPVTRRRRPARDTEDLPPRPVSSVLDKVMLFERSLDEFAQQHHRQHRASAYIPRRERFLYLQREPGVLERRVATAATKSPSISRPRGVDVAIQTDNVSLVDQDKDRENVNPNKGESDEEWFLQDEEWEDDHDDQEMAVVEWLLGDA